MMLLLTGAPGAGKGTQSDLLVQKAGFVKLSTGDLLRAEIKSGSDLGRSVEQMLAQGKLVPDDVILKLLRSKVDSSSSSKILLDGYPRNKNQAEALEGLGGTYTVSGVVNLSVDRQELVRRLVGRSVCVGCASIYHAEFAPTTKAGLCDKCGGKVVQRPDDQPDKVGVRLEIYDTATAPLLEYYRKKGCLREVDGVGSSADVFDRVWKAVSDLGVV